LYAGELLPGFYDDWVLDLRDALSELLISALLELSEDCLDLGDRSQALDFARRAAALDPTREGNRSVPAGSMSPRSVSLPKCIPPT
jgi:DNA-binding SARP family transcriptional activator